MRINRHDTNGTKPLLSKGELGYDDYTAGGDTGRVYVGTGTENIALAERLESNMMTKAQFNALAEERKANRAGSGFDEWGKHFNDPNGYPNVNQGMFTGTAYSNFFRIGYNNIAGIGVSKTQGAIASINGVVQNMLSINDNTASNKIQLPTAPTIYPYDTVLTTEQIASGVIKHADSSNSGLIVNGKFDTDTAWTKATGWSISGGQLLGGAGANGASSHQSIATVIGKKYIVEYVVASITGTLSTRVTISNDISGTVGTKDIVTAGIYTFEFTATANTHYLHFTDYCTSVAIDNIAVYPVDAISRADLVFPESYHEDIAEKGVGYPFGNVQYLGGNTDGLTGIANGAFTGFETYSLFGNWQTPSGLIGKGYVWSSLTEAQKRAFIANPENNCYLDGDKTIQVRYRVRVVQGLNDVWLQNASHSITPDNVDGWVQTGFGGSNYYLAPRGKRTTISEFSTTFPTYRKGTTDLGTKGYAEIGSMYGMQSSGTNDLSGGYEGKCFAIPVALVHRRNQGLYHNVYNPNGTKLASDGLDCFRTTVSFASISDCFDPAKLLTASGYIGTVSGRPDGLFYDQVHEGDITDLRNSSKKVEDYNRLITREFNKLVAGSTRGKEGEYSIVAIFQGTITSESYIGAPLQTVLNMTSNFQGAIYVAPYMMTGYVKTVSGVYLPINYVANNQFRVTSLSGDQRWLFNVNDVVDIVVFNQTTRTKSNTLLHCDIIGNPINYPTAWKESGVLGTPLIVAEDGTSLLPNGTLDSFKLSRKANATPLLCLRSTDNGATWTSFTPTFNTTTNAITLTDEPASNLVIVYYQTKTTMATPTVNSEVLELGEVLGTNGLANGALVSTLIGKVPTANTAPYSQRGYSVSGYRIDMSTFKFSTTSTELPVHSALSLAGGAVGVPAVKVLPYLTKRNGKAYLSLIFKEMKHNGISWGDDSKFNIVDNVSTTTDNNAQTVLIGQKTVELPYFIGADE